MPVLLIGAYGFIGCAIAHELVRRGQLVTGVGRDIEYGRRLLPKLRWVAADLARMTAAERWAPLLEGHDAVVNASGILQSGDGGSVEAV
ncbi:MAG TPA: saccharopine dehydrogenase NADP-binding domain-containing protein, partial [Sphingomicrobium sp.]|nr:saccharopine dehydrogenase NADP-binding domain-containing protein [Sphingomicrobium sp.]